MDTAFKIYFYDSLSLNQESVYERRCSSSSINSLVPSRSSVWKCNALGYTLPSKCLQSTCITETLSHSNAHVKICDNQGPSMSFGHHSYEMESDLSSESGNTEIFHNPSLTR